MDESEYSSKPTGAYLCPIPVSVAPDGLWFGGKELCQMFDLAPANFARKIPPSFKRKHPNRGGDTEVNILGLFVLFANSPGARMLTDNSMVWLDPVHEETQDDIDWRNLGPPWRLTFESIAKVIWGLREGHLSLNAKAAEEDRKRHEEVCGDDLEEIAVTPEALPKTEASPRRARRRA